MKNVYLIPTDKPSRLHLGDSGLVLCDLNFGRNTINGQNIYITDDSKIKEVDWVLGDFPDNPIGKVISKYGQEFTAQSLNGNKHGLTEYDSKKIILTTDDQLIQNGVQAIDDEFLEWFVKNPSCESVKIESWQTKGEWDLDYKIIILQEEPKNTCPKCRTKDFDNCHSIKCPMRKEEPKQTDENGKPITYWGGLEEPKQDRTCTNNCSVVCGECQIFEPKQETLEEFAEKLARAFDNDNYKALMDLVIDGAKFQAERMYSEEDMIAIVEKSRETGLTAEFLLLTEQFSKNQNNEQ
jgi:hypothetical protein